MKVKPNYTVNEKPEKDLICVKEVKLCAVCGKEYKEKMYLSAQSFGGSCTSCEKEYNKIVADIKKNGLK